MTRLALIGIVAALPLALGCNRPTLGKRIAALPGFMTDYRVDPYIKVAAKLQALGPSAGPAELLRAATNSPTGLPVFILCRMVFTNKSGGDFGLPRIGAFDFIGGTSSSDWPLAPIEVVDSIPFLVAKRWQVSGQMEPADEYVRSCMKTCSWSPTKFGPRTKDQKTAALAKLLASPKWRAPITKWDSDYLEAQLR